MSSNTIRRIDERLSDLDPGSTRYAALIAVRQFRTSWIELGRVLTEVAYGGDFKEWGYETFEQYGQQELGLKKPTIQKLMVSYNYMQKSAPDRLAAYEDRGTDSPPPDLPDYRTVELLNRARTDENLDDDEKERFHRLAFDDGAEETNLRKEIRGALVAASTPPEVAEEKLRERELNDIRRSCQVLRRKLADSRHVPEGLRDRFERLLAELEALE